MKFTHRLQSLKILFWTLFGALFYSSASGAAPPLRAENLYELYGPAESRMWKKHGQFKVDKRLSHDSASSFRLHASRPNDLRRQVTVPVYAGRYYRFSAWIKTHQVKGTVGANLSIYGSYNRSAKTLTGDTPWTRVEQVFLSKETGKLPFALRLGYWDATATGTAWFDEARIEELDSWNGSYQSIQLQQAKGKKSSMPLRIYIFFGLISYLLAFLVFLRRGGRLESASENSPALRSLWKYPGFWLLILAGFAIRLIASPYTGLESEITTLRDFALGRTPTNPLELAAHYPLLYAFVLKSSGALLQALQWQHSAASTVVLKLPFIVLDLLSAALLLEYLRERMRGRSVWIIGLLLILNPALIMASAYSGLGSAITTVLWVSVAILHTRGQQISAWALWAASFSLSPSWIILSLYFVAYGWRFGNARQRGGGALAASVVFILLTIAPGYAPADLWQGLVATAEHSDWRVGSALGLLALLIMWVRSTAPAQPELLPNFFLLGFASALLLPQSHQREWLPVLIFMTPLLLRGIHHLWVYLALTLLVFFKLGLEYHAVEHLRMETLLASPISRAANIGLGLLLLFEISIEWHRHNTGLRGLTHYALARTKTTWHSLNTLCTLPTRAAATRAFSLNRLDYAALLALFLFALGVLFSNLGALKYPTNGLKVLAESATLELRFDRPQKLTGIAFYSGETGPVLGFKHWQDGRWQPLWPANQGKLRYPTKRKYRASFKNHTRHFEAVQLSRLQLHISGHGAVLNELELQGVDGQRLLPDEIVVIQGDTIFSGPVRQHPFFDEQQSIGEIDDYRDNSYWDEVYYARSAYNLVNGVTPYEKTHPPLGKSLIGLGIRLFDMSPFGWRFSTTLVTALMPLLLFFAGREFTGRRLGAYSAAFLLVFECMPFSIGRMANIDTFMVFFLTAMLLALYRWFSLDQGYFRRRSIGWFVLAACCFGLAASIKWSALFTGFAIFILVAGQQLWHLAQLSRNSASRWQPFKRQLYSETLPHAGAWTLGFILLPALIYYLSHWEFLSTLPEQPALFSIPGLKAFWHQQNFILGYHGDHKALSTHSLSIPFYLWPTLAKPLAEIFIGGNSPQGIRSTISVLGNPAIWWPGALLMLGLGWQALKGGSRISLLLSSAYFLPFLPWILVERPTFLYAYYPHIPILILGLGYLLSRLDPRAWKNRILLAGYGATVIGLFVLFYPATSGLPTSETWHESLHWFTTWQKL